MASASQQLGAAQEGRVSRPSNDKSAPLTAFGTNLVEHIKAGYQILHIQTHEEMRVEQDIERVAAQLGFNVVTWDCFEGFSDPGIKTDKSYIDPIKALDLLANTQKPFSRSAKCIVIFRDLDDYFANAQIRRRLRTLGGKQRLVDRERAYPMIILSPTREVHKKLEHCMTALEFQLPTEAELAKGVDFLRENATYEDKSRANCSPELREKIIQNLLGLTGSEAEDCLARCLVRYRGFHEDMLGAIKQEKAAIIKASGVLTYIPDDNMAQRTDIGGFDNLLTWLERRAAAYSREARDIKLDYPKGIILLGPPGTGKSLVAKACARLLGLPGYICDVSAVFASHVGESEERMRATLKQVEAQQGSVLLFDEADKAFGGAADSTGDSGVTRRVFGALLTWLAEKRDRTFVIMTLNRTKGLPTEFLRAGRFDAIFYTDLPTDEERRQIMEIHLRLRGAETSWISDDDWAQLVERTKDFVGAELEEVVREARLIAFQNRKAGTPTLPEMCDAIASIIPMSQHDGENIQLIREFCKTKGRPVGKIAKKAEPKARSRAVRME